MSYSHFNDKATTEALFPHVSAAPWANAMHLLSLVQVMAEFIIGLRAARFIIC